MGLVFLGFFKAGVQKPRGAQNVVPTATPGIAEDLRSSVTRINTSATKTKVCNV